MNSVNGWSASTVYYTETTDSKNAVIDQSESSIQISRLIKNVNRPILTNQNGEFYSAVV